MTTPDNASAPQDKAKQDDDNAISDPRQTDHPTGEEQAKKNEENELPG